MKWLSSSQSRLNESHFVIVSVALFHSLIRTEVKGGGGGEKGRKKKKLNLFSKHSVSLTMSIGFRQIITPRGQNRGRQLFAAELDYSPFCSTAIVQWRRPFGLLLLLVNFLQQLFINKLEILNQLTIPSVEEAWTIHLILKRGTKSLAFKQSWKNTTKRNFDTQTQCLKIT